MLGYKGFDENLCCRGFQFYEGGIFTEKNIEICRSGFHFCDVPINVFTYSNGANCKYAIIEALGDIQTKHDKFVTNKIKIIKILTKNELILECGNKTFRNSYGKYYFQNNVLVMLNIYTEYQKWFKNGLLHRDNDLPALIDVYGGHYWFKDGILHRDNNLPAIIYGNGNKEWWINGIQKNKNKN